MIDTAATMIRPPSKALIVEEELEHFEQVYRLIASRGLQLGRDRKDPYLGALRSSIRTGRDAYFLDRLIVAGIAEARGCERFGVVAAAMEDADLREFYIGLSRAEERHGELFVRLACRYFDVDEVEDRLAELIATEAVILTALPLAAALH